MKKIIYILFPLLFCSCSDWFDIPSDGTGITDKKFFKDENSFYNALTDIYTQLRQPALYGENLSVGMLEFMGQHFAPYDPMTRAFSTYDYEQIEQQGIISNIWREMFRAIASCNKLIEAIEKTEVNFYNQGQKEIIAGEAYALRGALHFELLRLFHPQATAHPEYTALPYMKTFGTHISSPLSTAALLGNITQDLQRAAELLKPDDPILTGIRSVSVKPGEIDSKLRTFEMNYYAVTAMLARVALYSGDYSSAFDYANETFNHIREVESRNQVFYYVSPGKYGSDFSFSREHIFGIASPPDGLAQLSEEMFAQKRIETRTGLQHIFEPSDIRYRAWFTSEGEGESKKYILSEKFSKESLLIDYNKTFSGESTALPVRIPFIKMGEVALIAAEALNEQEQVTEAAQWIIDMETSKAATYLSQIKEREELTQDILRQVIRDEYEREFWGEGQLFFFYKRMNDTEIASYDGSVIKMSDKEYTLPVPAQAF